MAVGGNGIQVPVSLQVDASEFQSIIDKLKQSVNKLAPDSKLYSGLTKDLQKVEKEADAIRAALAQGFSNPAQLERFNQKVASFSEHIRIAAQQLTRAHFEDLNLNLVKPEDLQKLDKLKEAVDIVQQRVDNFQTDQMREIVKQSQEMQEAFSTLKLDVDTSDYTQAMKKANDQIDKLRENAAKKQQILTSKENALQKAQRARELGGNLKKFLYDKDARTDARYFRAADHEFKSGGKEAFFSDLSELGISPQLLQKVKNQSLANLNQFYKELQDEIDKKGLNFKINEKIKDLQDEVNIAATENRVAQVDVSNVEKLRTTLQELNNLDPTSGTEFAQKYQHVQEALQNVIAEYENYKKQVRDAAQLDETSADAIERLTKENRELRAEIEQVKQGLISGAAASREMNASQQQLTNAIKRWFSFREVINLTKRAIKDAVNHIKELDATMTQIAVVTNMTQADLWDQIGTYSAIAQQYGVTTNGVYQVSQLYYQQGLQTADVMKLTTETLKMAKIANLDYATATDYMTVALRGFKMEMDDAQRVTDVYSRLAAVSASDTEELAVAMSKTASSAAAVGSSFENTSAMIALMVETTREAPENIGSAMKSIISRYGELKVSPTTLIDAEGEELSFNKVDAALQSVGVSMHDANGQFRAFDEVIMDLSKTWQTLDRNTQRYIATVMAGNRQQSRFLALVSDYERLSELTEEAANAQDAGTLQYLKTLDSIDTKLNQLKVAFQEFYTSMGLEDLFKGALDTLTGFITKLNSLPKLFNTIPVAAMGMGLNLVLAIKNILSLVGVLFYQQFQKIKTDITTVTGSKYEIKLSVNKEEFKQEIKQAVTEGIRAGQTEADKNPIDINKNNQSSVNLAQESSTLQKWWNGQYRTATTAIIGNTIKLLGNVVSTLALTRQDTASGMQNYHIEQSKVASGGIGALGNVAGGLVTGGWVGAVLGLVQSIPNIITLFDGLQVTSKELVAQLDKELEAQKNQVILRKNEVITLESAAKKLEDLREHQYDSIEANQEYINYMNQLADSHSELISGLDQEGNSVIELTDVYKQLINTRAKLTEEELLQRKLELERSTIRAEEANKILTADVEGVKSGAAQAVNDKPIASTVATLLAAIAGGPYLPINVGSAVSTSAQVFDTTYSAQDLKNLNLDQLESDVYQEIGLLLSGILKNIGESSFWDDLDLGSWDSVWDDEVKEYVDGSKKFDLSILKKIQHYIEIADSYNTTLLIKQEELDKINEQLGEVNNQVDKWVAQQSKNIKSETQLKELETIQTSPIIKLIAQQIEELHNIDINTDEGKSIADEKLLPLLSEYKKSGKQWEEQYVDYYANMFSHTDEEIKAFLDTLKFSNLPFDKEQWATYQEKYNNNIQDFEDNYYARIDAFFNQYGEKLGITGVPYGEVTSLKGFAYNQWDTLITQLYNGVDNYIEQGLYERAKQYYNDYINILSILELKSLDSATSNAILSLIKSNDLTDYDSITTLINSLQDYDTNNENVDLTDIVDQLSNIKQSLLYNVNTIKNEYVDALTAFVKTADTFAKEVTKGLSYEDITAALAKIQTLDSGKNLNLTDIVEFSQTAGSYIYTTQGFLLAQQQVMQQIKQKSKDEEERIKVQQEKLTTAFDWTENTDFWASFDNSLTLQEQLNSTLSINDSNTRDIIQQAINDGVTTRTEFAQWFKDQVDANKELLAYLPEQEQIALEQYFYNLRNSLMSALDWEQLAKGTDIDFSTQQLAYILSSIFKDKNEEEINQLAQNYATNLLRTGVTALEAYQELIKDAGVKFDYSTAKTLYEGRFKDTASTISDIFNTQIGDVISEEANNLLVAAKVAGFSLNTVGVFDSFEQMVQAVKAVYDAMDETNASLAERNYAFAAYLEGKQLQQDSAKGIIESSADLSYDNLADYANLLGESLDDIITKGIWIIQDEFGKYRITDEGIAQLTEKVNVSEWELAEVIKSRNEALIEADKKINNEIVDEINALVAAKPGDKVDLTYLSTKFKDIIQDLGLNIENGLATITENTNIFDIVNKIQAAIIEDGSFLQSDIDALGDALDQLLKTYTSLIGSGISGTLSRSDATQLQNFATANLGGLKLDFNKTANGLKLSRNSAIQLYAELKKVDSLAAEIMLDNLADDIAKTDTGLNNISATMARIRDLQAQDTAAAKAELAVYQDLLQVQRARADSYSFMDNKLPEGMQGPENYWNAVGTAYKAMNESAKSGYMEVQDLYNIVNEMNNLANITGNTLEFMGKNLSGDAKDAADLITWAMQALSNVDGEGVKLDLSKLGVNLAAGADSMSSGFDKAINEMAESQIKMLDAEIALLEAVVAMEELGDIDVDSNGLELDEVFQVEKLSDGSQKVLGFSEDWVKLLDQVKAKMDESPDLTKTLESIKIQGKSLAEIIKTPYEDLEELGFSNEQYLSVMESVVKMATSGDYSIENVMKSVSEIAAANGISTEIQLETGTVAVGYGQYLVRDEKKDVYIVDGKEYKDPELALQAAALGAQKGLEAANFNAETNQMESEWRIEGIGTFSVFFEDNQIKYRDGNETFNSQQELINYLWEHNSSASGFNSKQDWAKHYNIPLELVPDFEVDSTALAGASAEAKQALAQELASGQVTEKTLVSVGIKYNKDLSNLADADLQQIADLAGIDRKTVSLNLAADITGDEGGKIEEMILKGQITVTMNLEPNTSSIDLTNLTATGVGTLALSDCIFTLDENGNVVIQNSEGVVITSIPVENLSANGEGTVDSYKLIFDQGIVKLVDADNQAVSSITFPATNVDPDSATGTVPEYKLTLENGHIKLYQGERELGSIPVPDKPVNDGSGTVEHYNLALADNAIVLLDSNNQVMNYIPVPGLKGDGKGYITTATFKFDPYSGMVSVVDSKNSDIRTQFPILDLAGIGTGTLAAEDCTFTYDGNDVNVQTKDTKGNDVIITVPLPDGKGTGSLPASNCTYTYNPNTGEIKVEGLDSEGAQASFTFNLADYGVQVAGTSSFNENQLTYTYQSVNGGLLVNVKGLDGQQFAFKIPSGVPIKGTGTFYQDNVELLYVRNPNGSVTVTNGTMTVDLPSDIETKAYGDFTQDNLYYTYKKQEDGTVHIEGFEGENKVIEFDVPEDVTTEANILSAILKWAGGGGWDYDELLDDDKKVVVEGLSVLGYVDNITLKKRGAALGTEIAALYNNTNFGLANLSHDTSTWDEDTHKRIQMAQEYLNTMEQLQTTEGALLTGQDRHILTNLLNLNLNNDAPDEIKVLADQAERLVEMDDANLQQMVTIIDALSQALGGLSPEQFISLAAALLDMATSSKDIFANDWDGLVNNLTSISSQNFSNFQTWSSKLSTILTQVLGIWSYIRNFANQTFTVDLKETKTVTVNHGNTTLSSSAKGNVALAAGRTLMGELGPELWVSDGHYYVAGQNGAEFVDLPKDAIVFNHLQTKKLLSSGKAGRGIAVTSDAAAVANAAGTTGPAMASAKEALAQLKQIRAMWQAMMKASAKDLGAMAGRGGGGGSGGGNDEKFNAQIGDFERWYNLLRKIENEEQKINQLEAERQNMRNGRNYMRSVEAEMESLHNEVEYSRQLADLQKDYYNRRRKDEEDSAFGKTIFTYTEEGLMQYLDGPGKGLDILAHLNETDENGKYINAAESAVKQLQYLASVGFDYSKLAYDNETGKALSATNEEEAAQIMEHFWDEFDGWIDELDGLRDSYNDKLKEIQDLLKKEADLRKDMIDDQIDLEQRVLDAIIKEQELIIEAMTKEKDALVEASNQYIEGLNKALQKERDLYNQNQDVQDRQRLQRQIDILKRSGGSASEIKTLSDQLTDKLQESYFDAQQKQIDAVKEASDLEIERLERQIELAQETLDYWRDNNLFNPKVQEILAKPAQSIIAFLTSGAGGSDTFKGLSQVAQQQKLVEITTLVQKWDEDRGKQADIDDILTRAQQEHEELTPEDMLDIHKAYEAEYTATMKKLENNDDLTEAEKKSQARAAGRVAAQEVIKAKTTKTSTTETTPESVQETTTPEPEKEQFKPFTGYFDKSGDLALYKERGDKSPIGYFGPTAGTGRTFTVLDYDPSTPDWAYVETSLAGKKGTFKGWAEIGASTSILKSTKDQLRGDGGESTTPTTTPVGGSVVRQPVSSTPAPSTPAPETKKGTFFGQIAEKIETKKTGVISMFRDLVTPTYDTKNLKGTLAPNALDNSVNTDNSVNIENLNIEVKELTKDTTVEEFAAAAKGLVNAKKKYDNNNIRSLRS